MQAPRRYTEIAMLTWFTKELRKKYPPHVGWFTGGQVANALGVSKPTSSKYLNRLVGQGELETEQRPRANGATTRFYRWV